MQIQVYQDPVLFRQDTSSFLEKDEAANNLALGIISALDQESQPLFMAAVRKEGQLVLVLVQTKPDKAVLSLASGLQEEERGLLGRRLYELYPDIPGLIGERDLVMQLVHDLAQYSGKQIAVEMEQRIYQLRRVKHPQSEKGELRLVDGKDRDRVVEWAYGFCEDARLPATREEAEQLAVRIMNEQRLYGLYVDGQIASMAAAARPTKSNITISFVYTPRSLRRQGLASRCVALLSQLMLDRGYRTAALYTDLANPTSNKIYMDIGYEPILDSVAVLLKERQG